MTDQEPTAITLDAQVRAVRKQLRIAENALLKQARRHRIHPHRIPGELAPLRAALQTLESMLPASDAAH